MEDQKEILVNNIKLSYHDSGEPGTPVILIHGFPFNKSAWEPQYSYLKQSTRVIAYDIRGFGQSTSDRERLSIDLFADDLLGLMNALGIEKAIVCGFSMGGYILLQAVNRYPERFKGIVLCDTQCLSDSKQAMQKRYETIHDIEENGPEDFTEAHLQNVLSKHSFETNKQLVQQIRTMILNTPSETITATLDALAKRKESCSILRKINVPTLVICGREDSVTPVPRSEFLFNTVPNAQLHIIEQAGHFSNLEQPVTFNEHLHNFIRHIT